MGKSKTLDFIFGEKHREYMRRTRAATINVAEGAVRAGKTVDNVFAFAYELETTQDKIHLATGSTIANAKLNIGDCNGYGLEAIFRGRCRWGKYKDNECLRIKTQMGLKVVIFAGGGKADSYKKIRGNSYGMWIATEINLHHDKTIKEAFNRQLAAKLRKVYWDLNPDNPNAPIYTDYINKYAAQQAAGEFLGGYNYEHFTIRDNATIPQQRIDEIVSQYDPESLWYRRDILGERCVAEGLVYPNFNEAIHVCHNPPDSGLWYISCDYGTLNPFSAGLWCVAEGKAVRVAEYYYDGRKAGKLLTDEEYYAKLVELAGERVIQDIVVDPSAASFIEAIRRHGRFRVCKAKNDVLDGIRYTSTLLTAGRLFIGAGCKDALREFGAYVWDEKAEKDAVIKENDHAMDDTRYFAYTVIADRFRW